VRQTNSGKDWPAASAIQKRQRIKAWEKNAEYLVPIKDVKKNLGVPALKPASQPG